MVALSEVQNMFWGVTLDGGKHYTQKVENAFHISMAALEPSAGSTNYVSIMLQHEKAEFMLCSLKHGSLLQQALDLNFNEGEDITLYLNGKGTVHLTGYLVEDEEPDYGDLEDSDEDDEDYVEEIPQLVDGSKAAKRKRLDEVRAMVKKARMEDSDEDDSDEDEDDSDEDDSDEDLDSEDYDEDEIGDDTLLDFLGVADEDSDEEMDDSDFDEDDEDEEELATAASLSNFTPKDKKKEKLKALTPKGKASPQNGTSDKQQTPGKKQKGQDTPSKKDKKQAETPGKKDKKQVETPGKKDKKQAETPGKKDKKQVDTPSKKDKKLQETPGKKDKKKGESPKKVDGAGDNNAKDTPKKKDKQGTPNKDKPETSTPVVEDGAKKKKKKKKKSKDVDDAPKAQLETTSPVAEDGAKKKKKKKSKDEGESPKAQQTPTKVKRVIEGGIVCEEVKEGHGPPAKKSKMVHVYYTGRLQSNGKVFDSNTSGKPFKFRLGAKEVIKGWDLGLEGMKVGGKRKLTIPAKMAYGNQRMGSDIPPNSTLCFEVELKNIS